LLFLACWQTVRAAETRPPMLRDVGIEQRLGTPLPLDAIFQDESGAPVRLGHYFGRRPVILVLAYYNCPMLCTQVFNGLVSALRVLSFDAGREFDVVAVSFDPRDRPADAAAKKKAYAEAYGRTGGAAGWHFLTGSTASIERVTQAAGFHYRYDDATGQFAHATAIYVATPQGKLSRYFYGIEYAPRDLRLSLIEASNSRIGSLADQILLFCYHYDPKLARYSAAVLSAVRLGGVAAVLVLSSFLTVMWRRDRKRDSLQKTPGSPRDRDVTPPARGAPTGAGPERSAERRK
jgi:protein SCO1/2